MESNRVLKSGWFRLWVVLSCALLISSTSVVAYYVWGMDSCYRFVTVSTNDGAAAEDKDLAKSIAAEATEKTFCGLTKYSALLTLEALASRGVVTQVGIEWKEPKGWSFSDHGMLDVLDKGAITAAGITSRVSGYVHKARLAQGAWFLAAALAASLTALALGIGVAWVRRGFRGGA